MKLSDFDYHLPPELIATEPVKKRDQSRLLVLKRSLPDLPLAKGEGSTIEHRHFFDLIDYLQPGDLLIANNSKVIPARLIGRKEAVYSMDSLKDGSLPREALRRSGGGEVEVFLSKKDPSLTLPFARGGSVDVAESVLEKSLPLTKGENKRGSSEVWECLIKGRVKVGAKIIFSKKLTAKIQALKDDGSRLVEFNLQGAEFMKEVEKIGHIPLPPYIEKRRSVIPAQAGIQSKVSTEKGLDSSRSLSRTAIRDGNDKADYQTIYALDNKKGSVAAPTAGLHFTPELLKKIRAKGVGVEYLTLHVGLGTFLPVKTEKIKDHKIHSEYAEVSAELIRKIIETKKRGGRIIAVGTTTTRTLEYVFGSVMPAYAGIQSQEKITLDSGIRRNDKKTTNSATFKNFSSWVDIFIYPPYKFKVVDALITNFHLPKSTLLMLVAAMAGKKNIDKAYQEAIKQQYRFYSYGDAMLIM